MTYTALLTSLSILLGFLIARAVDTIPRILRGPTAFVSLLPMIVTPLVGAPIHLLDGRRGRPDRRRGAVGGGRSRALARGVDRAGLQTVPQDTLESATLDGCTSFEAFRRVIIPVMWPGVVSAGLFSFHLAYDDFAVTAMLLSEDNQTMIPELASLAEGTRRLAARLGLQRPDSERS